MIFEEVHRYKKRSENVRLKLIYHVCNSSLFIIIVLTSTFNCLGCKYPVLRRVISSFGFVETDDETDWILFWTDSGVSAERLKHMKSFQRINHFPGMSEITRKDNLAKNMNRLKKLFPDDYLFIPNTWTLPREFIIFTICLLRSLPVSLVIMH